METPNKKIETNPIFKAFIRVVKSLTSNWGETFGSVDVVREPFIEAKDKSEVKKILLEKYPQFFQNGMVYEKETKDKAQFFYVVIYPLYEYEKKQIDEGQWVCSSCGNVHENKYVSRPRTNEKLFGSDKLFAEVMMMSAF